MLVAAVILFLALAVGAATFSTLVSAGQHGFLVAGQGMQAMYAAEAGIELSIKEIDAGSDVDGNGTTGSISAKSIGTGSVYTTYSGTLLTSYGSCGETRRVITITVTGS